MTSCRISEYRLRTQQNKLTLHLLIQGDVKRYLMDVAAAKDTLQYNLNIFRGEKEIWLDQCSYAISCLDKTSSIWQKLCHLFDEASSSYMDTSFDLSINELTIKLHYVYQQISQLISLITAFRAICRTSSKQKGKKRQEITRKFELFVQIADDLVKRIRNLLIEAQQERFTPVSLDRKIGSVPGEHVEGEQQPVIDKIGGLSDKSRRISHLVIVGKGYKGYENYVEGGDNLEQVSGQSIVSSDKEPLEV